MEIKVAAIIDFNTIVINKGFLDGINKNHEFLIYELGEDIIDPVSSKSLGKLEIVKGVGTVEHLQEHMTTLVPKTYKKSKVIKKTKKPRTSQIFGISGMFEEEDSYVEEEIITTQFNNVKKNDNVKIKD